MKLLYGGATTRYCVIHSDTAQYCLLGVVYSWREILLSN